MIGLTHLASRVSRRLLLAAIALLWAVSATAAERSIVGYAYDRASGELVYTEAHREVAADEETLLVSVYRTPDGRPFARRELRFPSDAPDAQPDFELIDERIGYREGVEAAGDAYLVHRAEDEGDRVEKLVAPRQRPIVIDAGFDRFIRRSWDQLQAGDTLRFDFVSCDRLSLIALRLTKRGRRTTPFGPASDFVLEPNNWFIRLLVEPIVITYLDADRSLLTYDGVSNVKRPGGGNYVVRIEFPPTERVPLQAAAAARSAP